MKKRLNSFFQVDSHLSQNNALNNYFLTNSFEMSTLSPAQFPHMLGPVSQLPTPLFARQSEEFSI